MRIEDTDIIKRTQEWWDIQFLELASFISNWSKDPSTKVGAIVVNDEKRIMAVGYNGLPAHIPDSLSILNDRKLKYPLINHAEKNLFEHANKQNIDISNCTIYVYPFLPCEPCSKLIISKKLKRVVAPICSNSRWDKDFEQTRINFRENDIELLEISV